MPDTPIDRITRSACRRADAIAVLGSDDAMVDAGLRAIRVVLDEKPAVTIHADAFLSRNTAALDALEVGGFFYEPRRLIVTNVTDRHAAALSSGLPSLLDGSVSPSLLIGSTASRRDSKVRSVLTRTSKAPLLVAATSSTAAPDVRAALLDRYAVSDLPPPIDARLATLDFVDLINALQLFALLERPGADEAAWTSVLEHVSPTGAELPRAIVMGDMSAALATFERELRTDAEISSALARLPYAHRSAGARGGLSHADQRLVLRSERSLRTLHPLRRAVVERAIARLARGTGRSR